MLPDSCRADVARADGPEHSRIAVLDPDSCRLIRRHEAAKRLGDALERMVEVSRVRELGNVWTTRVFFKELDECLFDDTPLDVGLARLATGFCLAADCQTIADDEYDDLDTLDVPDNVGGGEGQLLVMPFEKRCPHVLELRFRSPSRRICAPSSCSLCALSLAVDGDQVAGYRGIVDGSRGGEIDMLVGKLDNLSIEKKRSWFDRERD